jgi:OmpA-OmpF porin, OOP family
MVSDGEAIVSDQAPRDVPLLRSLLLTLTTLLFGVCSSQAAEQADSTRTEAFVFPDPARASLKGGLFVNVENLRLFARGMSKRQLYTVLGTPHFNEGVGVHEWNYLFNFRSQPNGDYFSCQLQVRFDATDIVQRSDWKPARCAALLQPSQPATAQTPAPPPAPVTLPVEPLRLQADALFAFDSDVLTAQGRRNVQVLAERVRAASQVQMIAVAGYSDRIGGRHYNLSLSQRRADTVRAALIDGGVPADAIVAEGRGEADPLVDCAHRLEEALIDCLAPNRRVGISGLERIARR